jgi:hypothetical protein
MARYYKKMSGHGNTPVYVGIIIASSAMLGIRKVHSPVYYCKSQKSRACPSTRLIICGIASMVILTIYNRTPIVYRHSTCNEEIHGTLGTHMNTHCTTMTVTVVD